MRKLLNGIQDLGKGTEKQGLLFIFFVRHLGESVSRGSAEVRRATMSYTSLP